jgi:alpha-L-arabinofuranosidase
MLRGGRASSATASVLTSTDLHAHNTFEQQAITEPKTELVKLTGEVLTLAFPPASVTSMQIMLS